MHVCAYAQVCVNYVGSDFNCQTVHSYTNNLTALASITARNTLLLLPRLVSEACPLGHNYPLNACSGTSYVSSQAAVNHWLVASDVIVIGWGIFCYA